MRSTGILLATALIAFFMLFLFDGCGKSYIRDLEKTGKPILATEYMEYSNWGWIAVIIIIFIGLLACCSRGNDD